MHVCVEYGHGGIGKSVEKLESRTQAYNVAASAPNNQSDLWVSMQRTSQEIRGVCHSYQRRQLYFEHGSIFLQHLSIYHREVLHSNHKLDPSHRNLTILRNHQAT